MEPVPDLAETCPYGICAPILKEVDRDGMEACAWPIADLPLRNPCAQTCDGCLPNLLCRDGWRFW